MSVWIVQKFSGHMLVEGPTFFNILKVIFIPIRIHKWLCFAQLRRASLHGALEVLAFFAILATFCQFGDFGNFLAIFLAHFDPWTICDNSLQ